LDKRVVMINAGSSLLSLFIQLAIVFWVNRFLIRRVSDEEYALLPTVLSIMIFISVLRPVLTSGVGRFITEAFAQGKFGRITEIVSTLEPVLLGVVALLAALGGGIIWQAQLLLDVPPDLVDEARAMLAMLLGAFMFSLLTITFSSGLFARQKFVTINALRVGSLFVRAGVLLVLMYGWGPRVLWVSLATAVSEVTLQIAMVIMSRRALPSLRFRFRAIRWPLLPELLTFGFWQFAIQIAGTLREASDPLILKHLARPVDLVYFQIGNLVRRQITTLNGVMLQPFLPAVISLSALKQEGRIRNVYLRIGRLALWGSCGFVVLSLIYAYHAVDLYVGPEYGTAGTVLTLLVLGYPLAYGNVMVSQLAIAKNRPKSLAVPLLSLQVGNVALTLILVGYYQMGAIGSATATIVAAAVAHPLLLWPLGLRLAKVTFGEWLRRTVWPGLQPALVAAPVWVAARFIIQPTTWLSLILCGALGGVVYILAIVFWASRPEDRADMRRVVARLRGTSRRVSSQAGVDESIERFEQEVTEDIDGI
jgi:O-antigen/teichoic acid export membrane protein